MEWRNHENSGRIEQKMKQSVCVKEKTVGGS